MSDIDEPRDSPVDLVWKTIAAEGTAMVGTPDAVGPLRPMTMHPSAEECAIWFVVHAASDFATEVGEGGPSRLIVTSRDGRIRISLNGRIEPSRSALHVERCRSPLVGARFDRGRDDPAVLLMRFTPQNGKIRVASGGILTVGRAFAMASLSGERPDLGDSADVVFAPRI